MKYVCVCVCTTALAVSASFFKIWLKWTQTTCSALIDSQRVTDVRNSNENNKNKRKKKNEEKVKTKKPKWMNKKKNMYWRNENKMEKKMFLKKNRVIRDS